MLLNLLCSIVLEMALIFPLSSFYAALHILLNTHTPNSFARYSFFNENSNQIYLLTLTG